MSPGSSDVQVNRSLAGWLCNLGSILKDRVLSGGQNATFSDEMVEAEACLREVLALSEEMDDMVLKQTVLRQLSNMCGRLEQSVGPAEAAALRSRLNALYAQTGRSPDTSCVICLEPLEQPGGGAEQDAVGGDTDSFVRVLKCAHQFHRGCLTIWWRTSRDGVCPLFKNAS